MASVHHPVVPARRIGRGLAAGVVALALVTSSSGGVDASPSSRLRDAKGRLAALTQRIGSDEAQARELEDRLAGLDAQIRSAAGRVAGIEAERPAARRELASAGAPAGRLQTRLDDVAGRLLLRGR